MFRSFGGRPRPRSARSLAYCSRAAARKLRRRPQLLVWVDLANSPHVLLLEPIVRRLREGGDEVVLTARAHAQTVELACEHWPDLDVVGGESPGGRAAKGRAIAARALALRAHIRSKGPDIAFSHGSYAQFVAARLAGVPGVTMMDYEHQPANHLSFRLARRVIVPESFPERALRRFGTRPSKVVRYVGFKEDLYLAGFHPDTRVLEELALVPARVIAVFRPPPDGALYHRLVNERFEPLLRAAHRANVQVVVLPRSPEQRARYGQVNGVRIPEHAVDARSLLALADVAIGGGGTMNREAALLGTPTYTVFAGALAAVDAELMRRGLLRDLREPGSEPAWEKKPPTPPGADAERGRRILDTVVDTIRGAARS